MASTQLACRTCGHDAEEVSRGRDGRVAYRRTVGKECVQKVVGFGEQVHVKPKRRPQTNRKQSLNSKWKIGTWFGMTSRSNEHIVIFPDGGLGFSIRARTVRRVSVDQRWNSDAIERVNATVKTPVPKIKEVQNYSASASKNTGTVITVWGVTQHCMERSVVTQQCEGKD